MICRAANAAKAARPTVEVRADGELIRRVAPGAANILIARGWGEWIGPDAGCQFLYSKKKPL